MSGRGPFSFPGKFKVFPGQCYSRILLILQEKVEIYHFVLKVTICHFLIRKSYDLSLFHTKKERFVTFCFQKPLSEAVNNSKIPRQVLKEGFVYKTGENDFPLSVGLFPGFCCPPTQISPASAIARSSCLPAVAEFPGKCYS